VFTVWPKKSEVWLADIEEIRRFPGGIRGSKIAIEFAWTNSTTLIALAVVILALTHLTCATALGAIVSVSEHVC
jgi:hypothetical protein